MNRSIVAVIELIEVAKKMVQSQQIKAGVLAIVVTFVGQPLSRSVNRFLLDGLGEWAIVGFLLLGLAGVMVVAANLTASAMRASIAGFIAGLMVWRGFIDGPLRFFSEYFAIAPIDFGGFPLGGRYALLMSTSTIMVALLFLYGLMNRETKCVFMRYLMKLVRWSPGLPTQGVQRSIARIAAMETVFVQWAIFLLFLFLGGWLGNPFYLVMLIWSFYLVVQLFRRKRGADVFRYAIPVSVVIWSLAEVGAFFGFYPEVWQSPAENPVSMSLMLIVFVAAVFFLLKEDRVPSGSDVSA
jgi:hypothetical protein